MSTIEEYLEAYLARPEFREQYDRVGALIVNYIMSISSMYQMAMIIAQRAAHSSQSKSYEPFLIENGLSPASARGLASLTISLGKRTADRGQRYRAVVDAIRFLAKPGRTENAAKRKAVMLLAAWEETSIIDEICRNASSRDASINGSEFLESLRSLARGDCGSLLRVAKIMAGIVDRLSAPRGRRLSAASAAHELFLENIEKLLRPRAYTRNPIKNDYTDAATMATRQEFAAPKFDPRPAFRRLRRRNRANVN